MYFASSACHLSLFQELEPTGLETPQRAHRCAFIRMPHRTISDWLQTCRGMPLQRRMGAQEHHQTAMPMVVVGGGSDTMCVCHSGSIAARQNRPLRAVRERADFDELTRPTGVSTCLRARDDIRRPTDGVLVMGWPDTPTI